MWRAVPFNPRSILSPSVGLHSCLTIWNLIFQCVARSWNPPLRMQSKCPVAPVGDSVQHKKKLNTYYRAGMKGEGKRYLSQILRYCREIDSNTTKVKVSI